MVFPIFNISNLFLLPALRFISKPYLCQKNKQMDPKKIRIVFMGTPDFAVEKLKSFGRKRV